MMKVMIKLFDIRYNNDRGMAWAGGYGPIEDLWFLRSDILESMRRFWEICPSPSGISVDPGARHWPDVLGCGNSPPSLFVSDKIVNSLRAIGAPMGRVTNMPVAEIHSRALRKKPQPEYFVVETFPGIEVDWAATGFECDAQGNPIPGLSPRPYPRPFLYRLDSWNGTDLFSFHPRGPNPGPSTIMFCSEKVKDVAETEGWTNVKFQPLELV